MNLKADDKYHHGDLRNALIKAAAELIEEQGSLDFAMIDAARRAGVSSAAPYRHFKDKDALLQAVAELGFLALTESVRAVADSFPDNDEPCIIAHGKNYISLAMCFNTVTTCCSTAIQHRNSTGKPN